LVKRSRGVVGCELRCPEVRKDKRKEGSRWVDKSKTTAHACTHRRRISCCLAVHI
jgi:hypothetical protein